MNGQSRTFVKQVQVDLLALCDADLSQTIQQWVDGSNPSALPLNVPEDTRLALGYTRAPAEAENLPHQHFDVPGAKGKVSPWWLPPSSNIYEPCSAQWT